MQRLLAVGAAALAASPPQSSPSSVDLSNEEFDEPRHSGDTIMRGELRA